MRSLEEQSRGLMEDSVKLRSLQDRVSHYRGELESTTAQEEKLLKELEDVQVRKADLQTRLSGLEAELQELKKLLHEKASPLPEGSGSSNSSAWRRTTWSTWSPRATRRSRNSSVRTLPAGDSSTAPTWRPRPTARRNAAKP